MIYYRIKKDLKYRSLKENQILTTCELLSYGIDKESDYVELISTSKANIIHKESKRFIKDLSRIINLNKIDYTW